MDDLQELAYRVVETERRLRNMMRYVEFTEVDPAKGLAKVIDRGGGEGKDLPSDWLPWMEQAGPRGAGNGTTWRPPKPGQRGIWFSPSGNLAEGILINGGFSDAAGQPSQSGDEHVETIGKVRVTYKEDSATIKVGSTTIVVTDGKVAITAADEVSIVTPKIKITGDIEQVGKITSTGPHEAAAHV